MRTLLGFCRLQRLNVDEPMVKEQLRALEVGNMQVSLEHAGTSLA